MPYMVVTLDMSKLSGWSNNDAPCRESNGGHTVCEEVQSTGRREVASERGARGVQGRARLQFGSRARGGAHVEHGFHVCDAGGVEAQRLVERRRALPKVVRGEHEGHGRDAGGVEAQRLVERRRAREHGAHGCDAGGVETQRLVERPRILPRVKRRAYGVGRGAEYCTGRWEVAG
eukprot:scaffold64895_cov59-Phaeocystis_antarctica.AAC.1